MTSKEALQEIKKGISYGYYDGKSVGYYKKHFEIIKKELRALKIIKKKNVIISLLVISPSLQFYNRFKIGKDKLTQKEFELLQEVFGNE